MVDKLTLHERLVSCQSTANLHRKAMKARRRGIWTQEQIDLAKRTASELYEKLFVVLIDND